MGDTSFHVDGYLHSRKYIYREFSLFIYILLCQGKHEPFPLPFHASFQMNGYLHPRKYIPDFRPSSTVDIVGESMHLFLYTVFVFYFFAAGRRMTHGSRFKKKKASENADTLYQHFQKPFFYFYFISLLIIILYQAFSEAFFFMGRDPYTVALQYL